MRYAWSEAVTSTLAGLTSRCTSRRSCAASSAAPTWATIAAARVAGSGASDRRSAPVTSRIDSHSIPSAVSPAPNTGSTFG